MKIMIIGADGQLGSDLCRVIPAEEQIPLTIKELDITDKEQTRAVIKKCAPQIVINTAAFHRVDDCEERAAEAFAVNTIGVKLVAEACREADAALLQISTDYVFDGTKRAPYLETDVPQPQTVYGISKLAGEFCVKYLLEKYFIVRTAGLYGRAGCMGKGGGNFVENMLLKAESQKEFRVVKDEVLSPTYAFDLARKIYELIQTKQYGIYHIVNHGGCSWHEFAVKIFELLGKEDVKIIATVAKEFKSKARRPAYSVLANANLAALGLNDMRDWREALQAYLVEKDGIPLP
jgi:dTDP-4-dehydrorhamnose reductase